MSQYLILVLFLMGWSTTAYGLAHMAHIKCPQWTLNDLVQISPIVVEGTVVSNGQNSPINGKFEVTFKVNTVYKGDLNKYTFVRLTLDSFTSSTTTSKNSTTTSNKVECPKVLKGFKHRKKRKYLIFAKDSRLFGLEVLAAPLKRTKRSKLALHRALCSYKTKYCHEACDFVEHFLEGIAMLGHTYYLDDSHIRNVRLGQTVRLNCQEKIPKFETLGRPRTKWKKSYTKWLKNGKPMKLLPNNIVIKSKRSKSVLKLKILHENDIATYTCVSNYRHYRKTFQLKIPSDGKFRKNKPIDSNGILSIHKCPVDTYCLNGGTCQFFPSIGELSCFCARGFYGQRCEFKELDHHNIALRSHTSSKCILGITHYPC